MDAHDTNGNGFSTAQSKFEWSRFLRVSAEAGGWQPPCNIVMQSFRMVEVVLSANPKGLHLLSKTNVLAPTGQLARDLGSYNKSLSQNLLCIAVTASKGRGFSN